MIGVAVIPSPEHWCTSARDCQCEDRHPHVSPTGVLQEEAKRFVTIRNRCVVDDCERALKKEQKWEELVLFYRQKGLHRRALQLLQKLGLEVLKVCARTHACARAVATSRPLLPPVPVLVSRSCRGLCLCQYLCLYGCLCLCLCICRSLCLCQCWCRCRPWHRLRHRQRKRHKHRYRHRYASAKASADTGTGTDWQRV